MRERDEKKQFCTWVTYDTQAACTSPFALAPRCTLQDQTSASSDVFAHLAHMSHYTHSSLTTETACMGWYLQKHTSTNFQACNIDNINMNKKVNNC